MSDNAAAFSAFEAAGWEQKAASYDAFFGSITNRLAGPLLDAVHATPGIRLLDVGAGAGHAAAEAARRGAQVVGMDVAEAMVTLARRLHPDLDVRRGDAASLPFADARFEALIANLVLMHVANPEAVVREFVRVLAPGSRLAVTVWDRPDQARLAGVFADAVAAVGGAPAPDVPDGPPFFRLSDESELLDLLVGAGLTEIRISTISFVHPVTSADALWDGVLAGTVRTSAIITRQPDDVRRRIRQAFDRLVAPWWSGDHLDVPVSVKLASGRSPGLGRQPAPPP